MSEDIESAGSEELRATNLRDLLLWLVGQRKVFRVTGSSMAPLLREDDRVLVDPGAYRKDQPSIGEIVIARHPFERDLRIVKKVAGRLSDGRLVLRGMDIHESTDSGSFGALAPKLLEGRVTSRF